MNTARRKPAISSRITVFNTAKESLSLYPADRKNAPSNHVDYKVGVKTRRQHLLA